MKKILGIVLTLCLVFSFTGCAPSEDEILADKAELVSVINDSLQKGDTELDFYVRDMTEKDIHNLNASLDGFWGDCDEYIIDYEDEGVIGGTLTLNLSDNYYVYDNYVNDTEIPKDRDEAAAVAEKLPEVLETVDKETEYDTELAAHDYIILNASYDEAMDEESGLNTAYGALVEGTTMCNGYADALTLVLSCLEIDSQVIVGESEGEGHAWNLVELDDAWYHVDPTWDDMDEDDMTYHGYFNVSDEDMQNTHEWEEEFYPPCDGESHGYYKNKGHYYESFDAFKQGVRNILESSPPYLEVMVTDFNEDVYDYQFVFDSLRSDEFYYYEEEVGPNTVIIMDL